MAGKLEGELKKRDGFATPQQSVVVGLLRTNDQFQYRFARLFREHRLTQPQYNVLRILRGEGAPLPCLEVADRLIAMVPAITGLVDKLEARGLVTRVRSESDRRVWLIDLTDAGRELLAQLDRPVLDLHARLCRALTDDECRQLAGLLEKAREGVADLP